MDRTCKHNRWPFACVDSLVACATISWLSLVGQPSRLKSYNSIRFSKSAGSATERHMLSGFVTPTFCLRIVAMWVLVNGVVCSWTKWWSNTMRSTWTSPSAAVAPPFNHQGLITVPSHWPSFVCRIWKRRSGYTFPSGPSEVPIFCF